MVKIICLANSKKNGDRCIAGIDICTEKWIRPVSDLDDGRVSTNICLVNNKEPQLLDILDIPLDKDKDKDEGISFQCENLRMLPGKWKKIGQAFPNSLLEYCEPKIFYSQYPQSVPKSFLDSLQPDQRRTLQLVKATVKQIRQNQYQKWEAWLLMSDQKEFKAKITDIAFIDKLKNGVNIDNKECLFTVSLAQPWRKSNDDELSCWKLIAGVIEIL